MTFRIVYPFYPSSKGCSVDIYVLNGSYSRIALIDEYESFIWTERYKDVGDFNLVVIPSKKMKDLLKEGNYLSHTDTKHIMHILTSNTVEAEDGSVKMIVTGKTMAFILATRAVSPNSSDLHWVGNGSVSNLAVSLVNKICVLGTEKSTYDIIPGLTTVNNAPSTPVIDISLPPQSLYDAVKNLCDSEKLGFEITLQPTDPRLRFRVYKGVLKPNVVFSSTLDNLTEESYLKSIESYRNVAYVWGLDNAMSTVVTAPGTSASISGFARRVMHVDATDIDPIDITDAEWLKALKQRGAEALAEHKRITLFDGKLTGMDPYKYGTHYSLGDIVTFQDEDGVKTQVNITEYIWASDAEGRRDFPTFEAVEDV